MALLSVDMVLSLFLSVLLLFRSLSFEPMALVFIHIVLSLFLFIFLLVPYQARSIIKTDNEEEEVAAAGKEEERQLLEYPCLTPDPALPFLYRPAPLFNSSTLHGDFLHRDLAVFLRREQPDAEPLLLPWHEHAVPHPTSCFHPATLDFSRHQDEDLPGEKKWLDVKKNLAPTPAPESVERARPGPLPAFCGGGVRDDGPLPAFCGGGVRDDEGATRKENQGCFSSFKRKAKKALKKFGKLCHRSSGDGKSRKKRTPVPAYDAVRMGCILCFNFPPIPPDSHVPLDARILSRFFEVPR